MPVETQRKLTASGYKPYKRFAIVGYDRPMERRIFVADGGVADALEQTIIVACWEVAKDRWPFKAESARRPNHRSSASFGLLMMIEY